MQFDHDQMRELAALKAYRYARDGGGGAHKVYETTAAWDKSRGVADMTPWRRACHEAWTLWRIARDSACEDYRVDCHLSTLDRDADGNIPF